MDELKSNEIETMNEMAEPDVVSENSTLEPDQIEAIQDEMFEQSQAMEVVSRGMTETVTHFNDACQQHTPMFDQIEAIQDEMTAAEIDDTTQPPTAESFSTPDILSYFDMITKIVNEKFAGMVVTHSINADDFVVIVGIHEGKGIVIKKYKGEVEQSDIVCTIEDNIKIAGVVFDNEYLTESGEVICATIVSGISSKGTIVVSIFDINLDLQKQIVLPIVFDPVCMVKFSDRYVFGTSTICNESNGLTIQALAIFDKLFENYSTVGITQPNGSDDEVTIADKNVELTSLHVINDELYICGEVYDDQSSCSVITIINPNFEVTLSVNFKIADATRCKIISISPTIDCLVLGGEYECAGKVCTFAKKLTYNLSEIQEQ